MKKKDVQSGHVYAAKVSGRIVPVRIIGVSPHGGWIARNQETGREIKIRSAVRLRYAYRSASKEEKMKENKMAGMSVFPWHYVTGDEEPPYWAAQLARGWWAERWFTDETGWEWYICCPATSWEGEYLSLKEALVNPQRPNPQKGEEK